MQEQLEKKSLKVGAQRSGEKKIRREEGEGGRQDGEKDRRKVKF